MTPFADVGVPQEPVEARAARGACAEFAVIATTTHRSTGAPEEQQEQRGVASRGACPPLSTQPHANGQVFNVDAERHDMMDEA